MAEINEFDRMGWEEKIALIKPLLEEIAVVDYPPVWVGSLGMSATDLLHLEEINDGLPEEMQLSAGEFVSVEGTEGSLQMPEVCVPKLSSQDVIKHLSGEMQPEAEGELRSHVLYIEAAKRGRVVIPLAYEINWVPNEELTLDDMCGLLIVPGYSRHDLGSLRYAAPEDLPPIVGVFDGIRMTTVPLESLTPDMVEDINEFIWELRDLASQWRASYVIPETERVQTYLAEHGEYFG